MQYMASGVQTVPAFGSTVGQGPVGVKHVQNAPAKVPQLHSVPSG
jgi:hypothetical protein